MPVTADTSQYVTVIDINSGVFILILAVFCRLGDYCEEPKPDPIPNSAVKLLSADGTAS